MYKQILEDLKQAMLSKDQIKTTVLRAIKAAILKKEISERKEGEASLTDNQILEVLVKEAKQRKDSIEQFEKAGRNDLSENEKRELEIIETYLPKQMSEEEIEKIVTQVINEVGASSPSEMGKVMGKLMPLVKGKADGSLVNKIVRSKLA